MSGQPPLQESAHVVTNAAEAAAPHCIHGCGAIVTRRDNACVPCAQRIRRERSDASRIRTLRAQGVTRTEATTSIREAR